MLDKIGNLGEETTTAGQKVENQLKFDGDPHLSQKVRSFFSWCSIFKKVADGSLLFIVAIAERPSGSNMWVPIVYTQAKDKNIACSYAELVHWYNTGKIVKLEPTETMSELVANFKQQ